MSKYKVFLSMDVNDSVIVEASDFLQNNERLIFTNEKYEKVAVFRWETIYGFSEVTE